MLISTNNYKSNSRIGDYSFRLLLKRLFGVELNHQKHPAPSVSFHTFIRLGLSTSDRYRQSKQEIKVTRSHAILRSSKVRPPPPPLTLYWIYRFFLPPHGLSTRLHSYIQKLRTIGYQQHDAKRTIFKKKLIFSKSYTIEAAY